MALYRCAACGSPNVVTDTQKEGYDYIKGAVGTIVLGVGGAAAGVNEKTKKVFKCATCGLTLSYAMPQSLKIAIDIGVASIDAREHLTVDGTPVFWDYLTKKYPNIEHGAADMESEQRSQMPAAHELSDEEHHRIKYADFFKTHQADIEKYQKIIEPIYKFKLACWDAENEEIQKLRDSKFESTISTEVAKHRQECETAYSTAMDTFNADKAACAQRKADAEALLLTLGAFDFVKKSNTKKLIKEMAEKIAAIEEQVHLTEQTCKTENNGFDVWLNKKKEQVLSEIDETHPLPSKPTIPFVLEERLSKQQQINGNVMMEILNLVIPGQIYTIQKFQDISPFLRKETIPYATAQADRLVQQGFLECIEENSTKYYYLADYDI